MILFLLSNISSSCSIAVMKWVIYFLINLKFRCNHFLASSLSFRALDPPTFKSKTKNFYLSRHEEVWWVQSCEPHYSSLRNARWTLILCYKLCKREEKIWMHLLLHHANIYFFRLAAQNLIELSLIYFHQTHIHVTILLLAKDVSNILFIIQAKLIRLFP